MAEVVAQAASNLPEPGKAPVGQPAAANRLGTAVDVGTGSLDAEETALIGRGTKTPTNQHPELSRVGRMPDLQEEVWPACLAGPELHC